MLVAHEQAVALVGGHERQCVGRHRGQVVRRGDLVVEPAARHMNKLATVDGGHVVCRLPLVLVVNGIRETEVAIVQIDGAFGRALSRTAVDDLLVKLVVAAFERSKRAMCIDTYLEALRRRYGVNKAHIGVVHGTCPERHGTVRRNGALPEAGDDGRRIDELHGIDLRRHA